MEQALDKDASQKASAGRGGESKAAYLIGHIVVKNEDSWAEYCRKVPATVAPWGASLVFRGAGAKVLDGEHHYTDTVVIRFPDRTAIDAWHESAAYQAIVPIRQRAADVVIISYEG
jgi:uncharacterized protein (DUF1330 family)